MKEAAVHRQLRCAVVGNSNSVMELGYINDLSRIHGFAVTNFSIGSCPNALLLHFLGTASLDDFDMIIAETAVVDCSLGFSGRFSKEESLANARVFASIVTRFSRAKLIFLVLPVQHGLTHPEGCWVSEVYAACAAEYGAHVLDIYALFGMLAGPAWRGMQANAVEKAANLLAAFDLPRNLSLALLWQPSRLARFGFSPLVRHFFNDDLHISFAVHSLVGDVLARWAAEHVSPGQAAPAPAERRPVRSIPPVAASTIERTSRLISRTMAVLSPEADATYESPPGYRAAALLINGVATCGIVSLASAQGRVDIDLRHEPGPRGYTAIVVPVPADIGDGPFTLAVRSGEGINQVGRRYWHVDWRRVDAKAEVAELVVLHRDMERAPAGAGPGRSQPVVNEAPWFADFARRLASRLDGICIPGQATVKSVVPQMFGLAVDMVGAAAQSAVVTQARLCLAAGEYDKAVALLKASEGTEDAPATIQEMLTGLEDLRARL